MQPHGAAGAVAGRFQVSGCALDHRLQDMGDRAADPGRVPQPLENFVAFPPVTGVEQIDPKEEVLTLAPVVGIQIRQLGLGLTVRVPTRVAGGVGRLPGHMAVYGQGSLGVSWWRLLDYRVACHWCGTLRR